MKIKPVILCGGSGTRLFPNFKNAPSKQFIDFGGWTLFEKTLDRIKAYEDAGADMIFPEAMKDEKEFEKVRKISKGFLLANMTEFGKSKLLNKSELENLGYNLVIYPVTTQRLAMQNVENGLKTIFNDGHQNNIIDKMQTRKRLYELVEYEKYNSLDEKIYNFSTKGHE